MRPFRAGQQAASGPKLQIIVWLFAFLIIATGAIGGVFRGVNRLPNWGSLQHEAQYVWQYHATPPNTNMFGYLPTAVFALWPFMVWPPHLIGVSLYVASNLLAAGLAIWIVNRRWSPRPAGTDWLCWVVLLTAANFQHVIQANQLTLWALALSVAGMTLIAQRRDLVGGGLLGLAGLVKSLPFLLVGYLLIRRKWRALAGVTVTVVVFDLVPSVAWFGMGGAVREHRLWLARSEWHSSLRQIQDPLIIGVYDHASNFSWAAVLSRWLRAMPDADELIVLAGGAPDDVVLEYRSVLQPRRHLSLMPMPRDPSGNWSEHRVSLAHVPRWHIADLSAVQVRWIWCATVMTGMGALAWATWRMKGDSCWAPACALWMLAMFWITPMMRHYYLVLAFPALAVVWRGMLNQLDRSGGRWSAGSMLAAAALLGWLLGVFCLGWDVGRWYGLHLGVIAILTAATAWAWRQAQAAG